MLRLKIENFDRLPDGGPLEYTVDRRGFDFGRDQHLDWSLPDRNRVVSGKHCEIRFHDNGYWLTDTSTNGTFLNRNSKRIQSPYKLNNGDVLSVGDYVLKVEINLPQAVAEPRASVAAAARAFPVSSDAGIWDVAQPGPSPIDARDLMPRTPEADRAPEFLYRAAYIPPVFEPEPIRKPQPAVPASDFWSAQEGRAAPVPEPLAAPAAQLAAPVVAPSTAAPLGPDSSEFVRRFAAGAGIPFDALARFEAGDLAEQSGELLRLACQHIMTMLRARAEAKALSRSGHRTMIQSDDNNPLKFMATPEEALRVMLGAQSKGYLGSRQAIESAFADLNMHQIATLAAMQSAVTQLFDELSPEAIAKLAEGKKSLLKGGKSQQWDVFAEVWSAKAARREHGMLGAFLELFAEQYDKLSKHKP